MSANRMSASMPGVWEVTFITGERRGPYNSNATRALAEASASPTIQGWPCGHVPNTESEMLRCLSTSRVGDLASSCPC